MLRHSAKIEASAAEGSRAPQLWRCCNRSRGKQPHWLGLKASALQHTLLVEFHHTHNNRFILISLFLWWWGNQKDNWNWNPINLLILSMEGGEKERREGKKRNWNLINCPALTEEDFHLWVSVSIAEISLVKWHYCKPQDLCALWLVFNYVTRKETCSTIEVGSFPAFYRNRNRMKVLICHYVVNRRGWAVLWTHSKVNTMHTCTLHTHFSLTS